MMLGRLPSSPLLRQIGTLMGGTLIGQLAVFAVTPVLTRLYTPEAFSDLGLYVALASVLSVIGTLRLDGAIPISRDDEETYQIMRIAMLSSLTVGIVGGVLTFFLTLLNIINANSNPLLFSILVAVAAFTLAATQIMNSYRIRITDYKSISRSKTIQGFLMAVGQTVLGAIYPSSITLALGDLTSRIGGVIPLLNKRIFKQVRRYDLNKSDFLSRYSEFIVYSMPAGLINTLGTQIPVILFTALYPSSSAGFYVFANRLITVPVGLLSVTLGQVYVGVLGKQIIKDGEVAGIINRFLAISVICALVLIVPVFIFADKIIPPLFGGKWLGALAIVRYLLILAITQIPAVTISQTLNMIGNNSWQLVWDIARVLGISAVICWSSAHNMEIERAVLILVSVNVLLYFSLILMIYYGMAKFNIAKKKLLDKNNSEVEN